MWCPSAYVHTFGSSVRAYVHACVAVLAFVGEFALHGCVHACMLLHAYAGVTPRTCMAHSRCRWVLAQPELKSSLLGDGGWAQQKGDNGQQGRGVRVRRPTSQRLQCVQAAHSLGVDGFRHSAERPVGTICGHR
jgi:hypothetical protein